MAETVAVAMSGGVDSTVVAAMLQEQGHEVVGLTLEVWAKGPVCDESRELSLRSIESAQRQADKLGIAHHIVEAVDDFNRTVVLDFIKQYKKGLTPNPCVICNPQVKFESLIRYATEELGIDKVATGHYARVEMDGLSGKYRLLAGLDKNKDQSYMLHRLGQKELAHILFPLGSIEKEDVKKKAEELGLESAHKKESQDVCFIPGSDYRDFLCRTAPDLAVKGKIVDVDGNQIGEHDGIAFYTIGQRRGVGVPAGERVYVVEINKDKNEVVLGGVKDLQRKSTILRNVHFVSDEPVTSSVVVSSKIRYNTTFFKGQLRPIVDDNYILEFDDWQMSVTPGQSAVFYDGEEVLGGGIITDAEEGSRILTTAAARLPKEK